MCCRVNLNYIFKIHLIFTFYFYISEKLKRIYAWSCYVVNCHVNSYLILVLNKIACHCKKNYVYVRKKYKNPVVVVCECDTFFVFHFQSFVMSVSKNPSSFSLPPVKQLILHIQRCISCNVGIQQHRHFDLSIILINILAFSNNIMTCA